MSVSDEPAHPTARRLTVTASSEEAGRRLDHVVTTRLPDLSRSQVQRLIRDGLITIGGRAAKTGAIVTPGMTIAIDLPDPAPSTPQPEALPLPVLYDDDDLVVVDKPAGMVVHPAAGHAAGTLVNALLHHIRGLSGIGGAQRPGIVHRLDKGTSGVMVIAKHDRAHRALARQFHDRLVDKEYVALVWGRPSAGRAFDQPLGRDPRHRQRISSRARHARAAKTVIVGVESLNGVSLVRVQIHTGRTHQIRVHLSEAGFPVVGDALYGGVRRRLPATLAAIARLDRPFLHASRLSFTHPTDGKRLTFEAPLPADLRQVVDTLTRGAGDAARARED
jgi:23S rRNA pseudouridine1911/1915/1917 synthase